MKPVDQRDGEKTTLVEPEDQHVDEEQGTEVDHEDSLIWVVLMNLSARHRCALRLGSSLELRTSTQLLAARLLLLQLTPTNNKETSPSLTVRKQFRRNLKITNVRLDKKLR